MNAYKSLFILATIDGFAFVGMMLVALFAPVPYPYETRCANFGLATSQCQAQFGAKVIGGLIGLVCGGVLGAIFATVGSVVFNMSPAKRSQFTPTGISPNIAPRQPGPMHCIHCGFRNPPGHRFCGSCGARLQP